MRRGWRLAARRASTWQEARHCGGFAARLGSARQSLDVRRLEDLLRRALTHATDHGPTHLAQGEPGEEKVQQRVGHEHDAVARFYVLLARYRFHQTRSHVVHRVQWQAHEGVLRLALDSSPHDLALLAA